MFILLINPPSPGFREHLHEKRQYPHLGLGYLQQNLLLHGHKCTVIDAKFDLLSIKNITETVKKLSPDLTGISSRTFDFTEALKIARNISSVSPVIMGGSHVSSMPYRILADYPFISFIQKGESEHSFQLLADSGLCADYSTIPGLFFRKGQKICHGPAQCQPDLSTLPYPEYRDYQGKFRRVFVMTTRGCPFDCIFCGSVLGKKVRYRPLESVISEIEFLYSEKNFDYLEFSDESFTLNKEYCLSLCHEIRKCKVAHRIRFAVSTRADLLDTKIIRELKSSGCFQLIIGAESGDPFILQQWKKGVSRKEIFCAVRSAENMGISVDLNFVLGAPYENCFSMLRTVYFIGRSSPESVSVSIGVPYPGTEYNFLAASGHGGLRLKHESFSDYNNQLGNALELTGVSRTVLELFQLCSYLNLFIRNLRLRDLFRFFCSFHREAVFFLLKLFKSSTERIYFKILKLPAIILKSIR